MGSGQATFSLNIVNGTADLKLGFQLGIPTDAHLPHQDQHPILQANLPSQAKTYQGRRKTPSQRRRDIAHAARHQAAARKPEAAETSAPVDQVETVSVPAVILPFLGKLLPVQSILISTSSVDISPATVSEASPANASVASPQPSRPSLATLAAPTKAVVGTPAEKLQRYEAVCSAKKKLFPADVSFQRLPPPPNLHSRKYWKKEDQMLATFFSV